MRVLSLSTRPLLVASAWLATATLAFAHAALTASTPEDGAMLSAPPAIVRLSFSEAVTPLAVTLVRPDGASTPLPADEAEDGALTLSMPGGLGTGTHLISWRVVSADGHPVGGALRFSIRAATPAPADPAEASDIAVDFGLWASKLALYLAIFFGIGGGAAAVWFGCEAMPARRFRLASTALGLPAGVAAVAFQGLDALGAPLPALSNGAVWSAAFETSFARTLPVVAFACLIVLLAQWNRSLRLRQCAGLLALVLACLALAATGHAASAAPQWLTRPAVFLHALAVAVWLGALAPLAPALFRSPAMAAEPLRRFSAFIPFAVVALILSGACLAVIQVERPAALLTTAYGRLLLAKLSLLVILLALAGFNRWRLTTPALAGQAQAARRLARIIIVETLLAAMILGLAAGWRLTPPPRVLALAAAEPVSVHMHSEPAMADVTIAPGHDGPVTISAIVMTGDFGPLDAEAVTFVLTPGKGAAQSVSARKPGDGTWRAEVADLSPPGPWTLRVDIRIDGHVLALQEEFSLRAHP